MTDQEVKRASVFVNECKWFINEYKHILTDNAIEGLQEAITMGKMAVMLQYKPKEEPITELPQYWN